MQEKLSKRFFFAQKFADLFCKILICYCSLNRQIFGKKKSVPENVYAYAHSLRK